MARAKKVIRKSRGNQKGFTSPVAGVYFRDDGNPRWIVRFRFNGKDYLPQVHYPVDLDETNTSSPTHVETARKHAEACATKEGASLRGTKKPRALYGAQWTLEALIKRVLEDFDDGSIELKSRSTETSLRVWVGLAQKGHNTQGFPTLTRKRLNELAYKDFYNVEGNKALNHLLKDRSGGKASNASVKKMLKAVQFALKRASNVYEIDFEDPIPTLKGIEANDARERTLTEGEWEAIIGELRAGRALGVTIDAIRFARFTAVRRGEAIKLDWPDINFTNKTAHLRGTKAKRGAYRERTIPLPKEAMEILTGLYDETQNKAGPVFAHKVGRTWRRLGVDSTTQAWVRARARVAKLTKDDTILTARVHDLRHTRITELGSIPDLTVTEAARISGHTDLRTFMRYFNPNPVDIGKKLDAYERAKVKPKGVGTIADAVNALVALGDMRAMYLALAKALEQVDAEAPTPG